MVPLPSDLLTTVIAVSGSVAPGFALAITGSFHFVILPRKIPDVCVAGELQFAYAGQVIGQHNTTCRYRQHNYPILDRRDFLIGHGCIASPKIDQALLKLLYTRAASQCLVVDLHIGMHLIVIFKPPLVERGRKCGASSLQVIAALAVRSPKPAGDCSRC